MVRQARNVSPMPPPATLIDPAELGERVERLPGVAELRAAANGTEIHLVGGAVRDLLLGAERADLDLAVVGDPAPLARRLGGDVRVHERFGTASARFGGGRIDIARTRTETYERPGALPAVSWATLRDDLARRDFSVNAMALPLTGPPALIDLHGGVEDLRAGRLRVLHERSFIDDPTRAVRAARYAARLDLALDPGTAALLGACDLTTVSAERVGAELRRLAAEPQAVHALALLVEWGLAEADLDLAARAHAVAGRAPYAAGADAAAVFLAAASLRVGAYATGAELAAARELADSSEIAPSALAARARGHSTTELVIARALGAAWVDDYVGKWRDIRLEIGGADLLAAGVPEGPALGRALEASLRAKQDGEASGRDAELAVALQAAEG